MARDHCQNTADAVVVTLPPGAEAPHVGLPWNLLVRGDRFAGGRPRCGLNSHCSTRRSTCSRLRNRIAAFGFQTRYSATPLVKQSRILAVRSSPGPNVLSFLFCSFAMVKDAGDVAPYQQRNLTSTRCVCGLKKSMLTAEGEGPSSQLWRKSLRKVVRRRLPTF